MNYNVSLDDIIKQNKSKIGLKNRNKKTWKNKGNKPAARSNIKNIAKKQNLPVFKAKLKRKKIVDVPDARIKIIQNKKRLRAGSIVNTRSPLLKDARLKIEARRQRSTIRKSPPPRPSLISRGAAVTSLAPNGIIHRRINPNLSNDNGIRVEYEDDDMMSLENEPVARANWTEFTIRRTVSNLQEKKRFPPTLMGYRDLDAEPEDNYYERSSLPFNELTRTITNVKPSPSFRKNYSSRLSSPIRQSPIDDMRDAPPPKSLYSSRESEYSSRDSNYSSRDKNYSSRESNYPTRESRESNYTSRDSNYSSRDREPSYYRIMISNLHENVTTEDIKELFEDIGDLVYTKMTRNGTAEVAYKYEKDAMDAVEIYHNRQLDGLPMKCTLISNTSEVSTLKKRQPRLPPVSTKSSVEPDTLLIKKTLFN